MDKRDIGRELSEKNKEYEAKRQENIVSEEKNDYLKLKEYWDKHGFCNCEWDTAKMFPEISILSIYEQRARYCAEQKHITKEEVKDDTCSCDYPDIVDWQDTCLCCGKEITSHR